MSSKLSILIPALVQCTTRRVRHSLRPTPDRLHVLFCMVDHYEPGTGHVDPDTERRIVADLVDRYPPLADSHRDASGTRPKRTWFFPPHYHRGGNLRELVSLCEAGYGEIELHLHHGKTMPDTPDNLRRTIGLCKREYEQFGIFGIEDGERAYAFIHGDWALNNSLGGRCCGVDNEVDVLLETGCYADFTFPSGHENSPTRMNCILYADPGIPGTRAYCPGHEAGAGTGCGRGLMLVQGPVRPVVVDGRLSLCDNMHSAKPPSPKLIDAWVDASVHIPGRPEWVIVKTHTHGATAADTVLGGPMHEAFDHLESAYNDGSSYVLHYVTARELYNIIRAAEDGMSGNPSDYRDYRISPPQYDSTAGSDAASEELREAISRTYPMEILH